MICLSSFFFFFCIWRTHVGKHKLNKPNSWNLPVIMLTLPSCWECQSESQCWPCVVKMDSVNNQITPCINCFCRNKLSKICIMEILGPTWAYDLKILCPLNSLIPICQFFILTPCMTLNRSKNILGACVNRCKDGIESIFH